MSDYDTVCYMTIPEYYFPLHLPVLIGGGGGLVQMVGKVEGVFGFEERGIIVSKL